MLNKICTDLTTSKRLKELGVEMETNFCWVKYCLPSYDAPTQLEYMGPEYYSPSPESDYTKAYVLEQILEMLPKNIKISNYNSISLYLKLHEIKDECYIKYMNHYLNEDMYHIKIIEDENLATTAARLLIKLIDDGIINLKE